ncbi:MAG: type II toxin-antitoxin system HicA family toxin [Pseudomonadota bacterium]
MNSKKLIRILEMDGWRLISTKGSHQQYKHPFKKGRVTVPHPSRDFPKGTLASIFKQAGIDKRKYKNI